MVVSFLDIGYSVMLTSSAFRLYLKLAALARKESKYVLCFRLDPVIRNESVTDYLDEPKSEVLLYVFLFDLGDCGIDIAYCLNYGYKSGSFILELFLLAFY